MHPKPQTLHLSQIFLVVAPAFILYGYNQAGHSALLDLPDVLLSPGRHYQYHRG